MQWHSLLLAFPLLGEDGSILPCWMRVLPQTNDVGLYSVIEGKVFEELEIVSGGNLTGGALVHMALLVRKVRAEAERGGVGTDQSRPPHVDVKRAEGVSTQMDQVWGDEEVIAAAI
jgi:hypothetical protein